MWEMLSTKHFHDIGEASVVYFLKDSDQVLHLRPAHPDDANRVPSPEDVDFSVHCMRGYNHPKSGVNIYKVVAGDRSIVYATDTEGYVGADRRLLMFARGADILMHDAMYTEERYTSMPVPTQGYGHSTVEIATSLAKAAGVGKLVLWHHDPDNDDDALEEVQGLAQSLFENSVLGHDGLELTL
jgi:ribonuclease BN (tRNA processing enzyme)